MEAEQLTTLRRLIAAGEVDAALEKLREWAPPAYDAPALQLSARRAAYRRDLVEGTVAPAEQIRRSNEITRDLLALLGDIAHGRVPNPDTAPASAPPTVVNKNVISGNVGNVGGDLRLGDNVEK